MSLDEVTLEHAAQDGEMDFDKWPAMVEPLLERLNHIVYNDFSLPKPYPIINPILPSQNQSTNPEQTSDPPTTLVQQTPTTPRTLPPVPPFPGSSTSNVSDSQPTQSSQVSANEPMHELPAELLQILNCTIHNLRIAFSERPPHTIQRLAELVLHPNKHYKTLPAWLRALDRVVSVSSTADIFPLHDTPPLVNGVNGDGGGGILWSNNNNSSNTSGAASDVRNGYDKDSLGSDESLGGALLTPIPWLKDINSGSSSGGTNGSSASIVSSGSAETGSSKIGSWQEGVESESIGEEDMLVAEGVDSIDEAAANAVQDAAAIASVAEEQDTGLVPGREHGAVTQGELMRMEQEAGVVPVVGSPLIGRNGMGDGLTGGRRLGSQGIELDDEGEAMPPHARGPDIVGTVDMGLVEGQEREVRISSPPGEEGIGTAVDPNDAQDVLEGGGKPTAGTGDGIASSGSSDGYVDVGKDEMQIDPASEADSKGVVPEEEKEGDGDIVLVDADGANEDQDQSGTMKADESGVNIGADTADTSAQ